MKSAFARSKKLLGRSKKLVTQQITKSLKDGRFARFDLDRKLEPYLSKTPAYFIEIGGYDGVTSSNTYYLEYAKGWRGLLVEATPSKFLECFAARGSKSSVVCCACVPFDYEGEFVRMTYADAMTFSKDVERDVGDQESFLNRSRTYMMKEERVFDFGAVARTLTDVLKEVTAPTAIDFFSLDVEGAEMSVLTGLDFSRYKINNILVECRDVDRMTNFLGSHGYSMIEKMTHHDYLFRLDAPIDASGTGPMK